MKAAILSAVLASGVFTGVYTGHVYAGDEPTTRPAVQADIPSLIKDLGSDDWKTRESATDSLANIGAPALPALQDAAKSSDLETRTRAEMILKRVASVKEGHKTTRRKLTDAEKNGEDPANANANGNVNGNGVVRRFAMSSSSTRVSVINGHKTVDVEQNGEKTHVDCGEKIVATMTRRTDDEEITDTYEAASVEDFQKKYPEVYAKVGPFMGDNIGGNMKLPGGQVQIQMQGNVQIGPGGVGALRIMPGAAGGNVIIVPGGPGVPPAIQVNPNMPIPDAALPNGAGPTTAPIDINGLEPQ